MALGALRTLRRSGLQPGADVSVIGIDDHPLADLTDLTTIRQSPAEQGATAGQMVLDLLAGRKLRHRNVLAPTELVVRGSTGPPRAGR